MKDDTVNKTIFFVIGLVLSLIIIGVMVFAVVTGKNFSEKKIAKLSDTINELDESQFTDYDQQIIPGNQVLSLLNTYQNEKVSVCVKTKRNTTYYNYKIGSANALGGKANGNIAQASNKEKDNYIHPNGQFMCEVLRDNNETITGITFVQQ